MTERNLEKELHLDVAHPDELQPILLGHYKHAMSTGDRESFGPDQDSDRLVLRYEKDRLFVEKILDEDIPILERLVRENLIDGQVEAYAQTILFSHHHPIKGFFRYKNVFQIVPAPSQAPQPPFAAGEHSCLLQVRYLSSPNRMINDSRVQQRTRELVNILNVLTRGAFKPSTNLVNRVWVLGPIVEGKPWTYNYGQTGYSYEGFNPTITDFADVVGLKPIDRVDEDRYYAHMGYAAGNELVLPATLERDLDAFFGLDTEEARRFEMASIWTSKVHGAWGVSRSLAFIAAVTAIEALIPKISEDRTCPECKRAFNPGSGRRFRDFLKKYVPTDRETTALVADLYRTRSNLSHGDYVMHSDASAAFMSHLGMKEDSQLRTLNTIMYRVLRGWLLDKQGMAVSGEIETFPSTVRQRQFP
jgi:hypothetical protein